MQSRNEVHLTGGIVRIHESKIMKSITIATTVAGVDTAYPTIIFFDPDKVDDFKVGDRITVNGHVQTHITEEDGRRLYRQTIVGDKAKKTERMLAPFIEDESISKTDGGFQFDENYTFIFGTVRRIYAATNGVYVLTVAAYDESEHVNYCEVSCFRRQASVVQNLELGDFVMIGAAFQTRRNSSGKTIQNIVCRDILKCEKES